MLHFPLSLVYSLLALWPMEAVSWTRNGAKIGSCLDSNATQPKGSFSVSVGALKGATFVRF